MATERNSRLEIEEDLAFEQRVWRFQRAGRIGLALFLLLAFLGLAGSGPLSNASTSTTDQQLSVSFERFDRAHSPSTFEVRAGPDMVVGGELQIWINSEFIVRVQIDQITPEPERIEIGTDRYVYTFAVSTESTPAPVSIQFVPERPGISRTSIGIVNGPDISLRQFVLP